MKYCTKCGKNQEGIEKCAYCGGELKEYARGQEPEVMETEEERRARIEAERLALNDFDIIKGVLVKYLGTSEKVVVPRMVKEIGKEAFKGKTMIKEVILPERTSIIRESAFHSCSSLEKFTISENIQTIENCAFAYTGIKKAVIPKHLKTISNNMFYGCTRLKEVVIEEGVERIEAWAFYGCSALDDLTLPNGLRVIGSYAFNNCTLYEVYIPDSVTKIEIGAFAGSPKLLYVEVGKNTAFYADSFDVHTEVVVREE